MPGARPSQVEWPVVLQVRHAVVAAEALRQEQRPLGGSPWAQPGDEQDGIRGSIQGVGDMVVAQDMIVADAGQALRLVGDDFVGEAHQVEDGDMCLVSGDTDGGARHQFEGVAGGLRVVCELLQFGVVCFHGVARVQQVVVGSGDGARHHRQQQYC